MLKDLNLILKSPLEQFEVSSLISLIAPIFGYINITLSNLGLYSILILFIILSLHIISNNENKILPSK
jgi:F-type H+-transporting ATPase subunit a